jgi:tRNA(Ile)-lysidine synthase
MILAAAAQLEITAHHVHHGLRPEADTDAEVARAIAARLGTRFILRRVSVEPGPNLEARARAARYSVLPDGAMTGHTADDQAETVLLRLMRGAGADGLAAMQPGPTHPILALRRAETVALCAEHRIDVALDTTNTDPAHQRNRVRHEVLPALNEIARRDLVPVLVRTADVLRDDAALLDELAAHLDPTDARGLAAAPVPLARRAIRRWLTQDGYPPDAAAVERVLEVARGVNLACEITGGRRVSRSEQLLEISPIQR